MKVPGAWIERDRERAPASDRARERGRTIYRKGGRERERARARTSVRKRERAKERARESESVRGDQVQNAWNLVTNFTHEPCSIKRRPCTRANSQFSLNPLRCGMFGVYAGRSYAPMPLPPAQSYSRGQGVHMLRKKSESNVFPVGAVLRQSASEC